MAHITTGKWFLLIVTVGTLLLSPASAHTLDAAVEHPPAPVALSDEEFDLLGWMPDGRALLVSRPGDVVTISQDRAQQLLEVWLLTLDGRGPSLITRNGILPRPSSDGREIFYYSYAGREKWSLVSHDFLTGETTRGPEIEWASEMLSGIKRTSFGRQQPSDTAVTRCFPSPDGALDACLEMQPGPEISLWTEETATGERREYLSNVRGFISPISWAPHSQAIILSRTSAGTGDAGEICQLDLVTGELTAITTGQHPLWSPDGRRIGYECGERVCLLSMDPLSPRWVDPPPAPVDQGGGDPVVLPTQMTAAAQLTPPATIRVLHSEKNFYRSEVPPGQIDVVPFEEYVKRVVPYEVYRSWPFETLKAQAVAARTYAWWFIIRHVGWDFDVNDWIDYQVMGNATYPETNAAVDATQGQYIAYGGEVILAEFSNQNGSPTVTRAGYPYMRAVDDPVNFGERREIDGSHGRGFSQQGGKRWAAWHGWTYEQMLTHYYTGVTVERPANGSPLPDAPEGAVVRPAAGSYVTSQLVDIRVNASDADGDLAGVNLSATWQDAAGHRQTQYLGAAAKQWDGWHFLWDITSLPDQSLQDLAVIVTGAASDAGARQTDLITTTFGVDRDLPAGSVLAPGQTADPVVPITVTAGSAGASGMAGFLLSNDWVWEETAFYYFTGSGAIESDSAALDGQAWVVRSGDEEVIYGPYTRALDDGRPYRAIFRLKTDTITDTAEIAALDVADDAGRKIIGLRRLRGIDFRQANVYQEFGVDFWYRDAAASGLEFRIAYLGPGALYFDRVLVALYPIPLAGGTTTIDWSLPDEPGTHIVRAKFADNAGNLSADQTLSILLQDFPLTPTPTRTVTPSVTATSSGAPTGTPTPTSTATPENTATLTPGLTMTPTPTVTPDGTARITLSLDRIFADLNRNGIQDAGEGQLADVSMTFVTETGENVVPPTVGGSWYFTTDAYPGRRYLFIAEKPGFRTRVETVIAPDAGLEINLNWNALPMHPWSPSALLPLIVRDSP